MHGFADDVAGGAAAILGDGMLNYLQNIRVPARVPLAIALHSRFASIIGAHLLHLNHLMKIPTHTKVSLLSGVLGACYMAYPLGGLLGGEKICTSLLAYTHMIYWRK